MFTGLKAYGTTAKNHLGWTVVLLVVVALFVAVPLRGLLARVPVVNQLPGVNPAA